MSIILLGALKLIKATSHSNDFRQYDARRHKAIEFDEPSHWGAG